MGNVRKSKVGYQPAQRKGFKPYLRLGGQWLRQAGIEIGQQVTVEIAPGMIVIRTGAQ